MYSARALTARGTPSGVERRLAKYVSCTLDTGPKLARGNFRRSRRPPERGWSRHLGKVAAFDPNPCTVDADGCQSGAVLWETQPGLHLEHLATFRKRSCEHKDFHAV